MTCLQNSTTQMRKIDYMNIKIKRFAPYALHISLLLPYLLLNAVELPIEFHGRGYLGKYLNSDTIRYNMDASIDLHCTVAKHENFSFFVSYRDDLDMAEQRGGVSLDPRYAHYYITGGFDYLSKKFLIAFYFMHDCIHDIDYDVEGTPVFNRLRLQLANADYHPKNRHCILPIIKWNIELGYYPHWKYHGWDINAGADYQYGICLNGIIELPLLTLLIRRLDYGLTLEPSFHITRGDTCFYHQHVLRLTTYYAQYPRRRIGVALDYNILNNDPIKSPDKLWLLSIFVAF